VNQQPADKTKDEVTVEPPHQPQPAKQNAKRQSFLKSMLEDEDEHNFDTIHVLTHTHWDREWYLSFEIFRRNLILLLHDVLTVMGADLGVNVTTSRKKFPEEEFWHFHLDGQMAPVLDYLEIYPQHRSIIANASREDKVSLGPWYVQPDEYLVSGEALIRNLMKGIRSAIAIGGKPTLIGYLPDSFGHISQLPQIYKGKCILLF
jgi:alpha-mannosidase